MGDSAKRKAVALAALAVGLNSPLKKSAHAIARLLTLDRADINRAASTLFCMKGDDEFGIPEECEVCAVGGDDYLTSFLRRLKVADYASGYVERVEMILRLVEDRRVGPGSAEYETEENGSLLTRGQLIKRLTLGGFPAPAPR